MSEFFAEYGLFIVEFLTVILVIGGVAVLAVASAKRVGEQEGLIVKDLNRQIEEKSNALKRVLLDKHTFKKDLKAQSKERKRRAASAEKRPRVFVLDFKGDLRASAAASLREEVSAVLSVAGRDDKVLLRLENSGGAVHEHGFAASQLLRLKERGIELVIAVDKVAASGGYLMACVADRIIAAPFAVIGSIGVIWQLPNFHRLLEGKGVDYEQVTAGRYKRTLTLFGENTDEGREKLKQEVEDVHELFKRQIAEQRPMVDLERVATGEHWYGLRALDLKLVDALGTSDDYLLEARQSADVYGVSYKRRRPMPERILSGAESLLSR